MLLPDDLVKILLAVLVGGAFGVERELRDKAAGLRTLIFISVGATCSRCSLIQHMLADPDIEEFRF